MTPGLPVGMEGRMRVGLKYPHHKLNRFAVWILPVFVTISILSWLNTYLMNSSLKPLTALNSFQVANDSANLHWWEGGCLWSLPKKKKWFKKNALSSLCSCENLCLPILFYSRIGTYERHTVHFSRQSVVIHVRITYDVIFVLFDIIKH